MSNRQWTFKKHIMLSFIMTMISVLSRYVYQLFVLIYIKVRYAVELPIFDNSEAASIAIIGGADGANVGFEGIEASLISMSGSPSPLEYMFFFIVLILLYVPIRKALNNAFWV